MRCGLGHCGHCQLGPTLICRDGPVYRYDEIERTDGGARAVTPETRSRRSPSGSSRPATAASCRCSTARTSCSRSRARSRSPTSSRRAAPTVEGPVRPLAGRGLGHDRRTTSSASRRCAAVAEALVTIGACATAGGIQALQNFARRRTTSSRSSTRRPSTSRRSRPRRRSPRTSPVDFELHGCPINKRQLLEVITAFLHGRRPNIPATSVCIGVQGARHGLRDGRARHAVPRPGDARRLRRDLPAVQPRLLRLLRPDGDAEHRLADAAAAGAGHGRPRRSSASSAPSTSRRSRRRVRADG